MLKWGFGIQILYTVTKADVLRVRNNTGLWVQSLTNYRYCVLCEARGWCELFFLLVTEKQVFGVRYTELVNIHKYIHKVENYSIVQRRERCVETWGLSSSSRQKMVQRDQVQVHSHASLGFCHCRSPRRTCSAPGLWYGTAHLQWVSWKDPTASWSLLGINLRTLWFLFHNGTCIWVFWYAVSFTATFLVRQHNWWCLPGSYLLYRIFG